MSKISAVLKGLAIRALKALKSISPQSWLHHKLTSYGADFAGGTVAIDIGASYFPHVHWDVVRRCPNACWIAIDPNADNLQYLEKWQSHSLSKLVAVPTGVSQAGGKRTLYVTNIDSGSSILRPDIGEDWNNRVDHSYFFPVREVPIECTSLNNVLEEYTREYGDAPLWIKLDTQGSECDILSGLDSKKLANNVITIESECTLQRIPIMTGSGKLVDLISMLEPFGFELVHLDPISASARTIGPWRVSPSSVVNECDAVFILSPSHAIRERPLIHNLSLISAYIAYGLYHEASCHAARVLNRFSLEVSGATSLRLHSLRRLVEGTP